MLKNVSLKKLSIEKNENYQNNETLSVSKSKSLSNQKETIDKGSFEKIKTPKPATFIQIQMNQNGIIPAFLNEPACAPITLKRFFFFKDHEIAPLLQKVFFSYYKFN